MLTRRMLCACGAALLATDRARAAEECVVFDKSRQSAITPGGALDLLFRGNRRFVEGNVINCDLPAEVRATAESQYPFAAVLGCIDSRVAPELVFDQHIGDIFSVRVAGNVIDTAILGSLEYTVAVAGAKGILVLGHSNCGAIKGAIDRVMLGNLTDLLAYFGPSLDRPNVPGERNSHNRALVQAVAEENVRYTVRRLLVDSPVIAKLVQDGKVEVAGAMHDVSTGRVTRLTI